MGFITTTDEHIASGGTISGNLTIDADLTVSGSTAITTNEVIQGTSIIDVTNAEALLIRKNGDAGDIFIVDTTNSRLYAKAPAGSDPTMYFEQYTSATNGTLGQINFGNRAIDGQLAVIEAINDGANDSAALLFKTEVTSGALAEAMRITSDSTVNPKHHIKLESSKQVYWAGGNSNVAGDGTNLTFGIGSGGSATFNGNVGIGTTTPGFGIDSGEAITNASTLLEVAGTGGNSDGATIVLRNTATAIDASTDPELGMIKFAGNDTDVSLNEDGVSSMIRCLVTDTWNATTNDRPSQLEFWTTADGSSAMAQRMTINKNGWTGIGTGDPATNLHVKTTDGNHGIEIESDSAAVLTFDHAGNDEARILFKEADTTEGSIIYTSTGTDTMQFKVGSNGLRFKLDANSRMSLSNNDTGTSSTVFGYLAGMPGAAGAVGNIFIGQEAGENVGSHDTDGNVMIGYRAGRGTFTATTDHNVGIGYTALNVLTSGHGNVVMGSGAGIAIQDAESNVAIGRNSLGQVVSSNQNIALGFNSAYGLTTGANNTVIGAEALYNSADIDRAVVIGKNAMYAGNATANADGTIAIGYDAARSLITGAGNIAIGYESLNAEDGSGGSTALGYKALKDQNGSGTYAYNTAMGFECGLDITTGLQNVMIGAYALGDATTEVDDNVAIGYSAMGGAIGTEAVNDCVAIGSLALDASLEEEASGTIAIGKSALGALTSGAGNVAVGFSALMTNTDGFNNTAIGYNALKLAPSGSIYNTAVGHKALESISHGDADRNTAVGHAAGDAITDGLNNTCIGNETDPSASGAINQTVIGNGTTGVVNNSVTLGNSSVTKVYMSQDGDGEMYANGTINTSDKRLKENINDTDLGLSFVNALRPVSYKFINDKKPEKLKYGIIAQEVQEVLKESSNEDFAGITDKGDYLGADYVQFIAPLIKAVQELTAKVEALEKK